MKIIEFGAKWCGPCKSMKPIFAKFEKAVDVQLERKDLDVEADYDLSEKLAVRAIPTVVWLSDEGKELVRVAGVATLAELEAAHRRAEQKTVVLQSVARRLNKASPSDAVINMNLAEQTRKVLATLTPREEKVLRMRFGIGEKGESASKKDKGPKTKKARS